MIPAAIAIARLVKTATTVTRTMAALSDKRPYLRIINVFHWNVERTTMKRTPVNVAIGSRLMNGLKMSVNNNMKTPDIVELTR
mmetsp:Transcript_7351/g.10731  ORF Transcript_7351/g.10731 Transcript_7351/m.10731 type:complete len:83 (-) Transcript_7351:1059-1307(-)